MARFSVPQSFVIVIRLLGVGGDSGGDQPPSFFDP